MSQLEQLHFENASNVRNTVFYAKDTVVLFYNEINVILSYL